MNYILGIDVGTSNVKAVLFDAYGNEASVVSQESKTISAGRNEVEQDMNAVWEKVKYCVKNVVASGVAKKKRLLESVLQDREKDAG